MNRIFRGAWVSRSLQATFLVALGIPATTLPAQTAPKVAVIDVQRLVFESKTGKEVLERLKNLSEQKAAEGEALQQDIEELQARVQTSTLNLSEEKIAEMEKELEDKMIELRRFSDDAERTLQKEQQDSFEEIEREMMPIITQIGREEGYTLIFNKFNSGLLYAVEGVDITDRILQLYDARTEEGG